MELSDWRNCVPFGAFLQPIRLSLAAAADGTSQLGKSSAIALEPSTTTASEPSRASEQGDATAAGAVSHALPTAHEEDENEDELLLLPFQGACVQQRGDRMVVNAGGPVWALDWLPQASARRQKRRTSAVPTASGDDDDDDEALDEKSAATEQRTRDWRILALSAHPPCEVVDGQLVRPTPPDHYFTVDASGVTGSSASLRSLIQVWAIPVRHHSKTTTTRGLETGDTRRPTLVYAIDHSSGVAWDLQWCPLVHDMPSSRVRNQELLGVLAVCFGDGSVQVFEVPEVPFEQLTSERLGSKPARVETLQPTICASVPNVLQLSVQWSPHRWNLLLTGGSDGS